MAPKKFDECAKKPSSKIRTKTLSDDKYMRVCIPKGGKSVGGHVKTKKK